MTVGILDTGVTLDNPALATTTTGAPKVVDWVTYTHPLDDGDPTWVTTVPVSGPSFTSGGATYTAPAGAFRFGVFDERHPNLGGEVGNDVNRDGNPRAPAAASACCGTARRACGSTSTRTSTSPTSRS
ncbi:hypothetical protein ACFQV2_20320 [Actinokineospora soli]|uniref:Subtilase family protein n=1 Tax=Actinokineospora soli TaxID=1048753 RepID=A0ABW2TNX5_9PSEU